MAVQSCAYVLPPSGLEATLWATFGVFCSVDSRFSIIWKISTIFFRGLWEDFLASVAHKRNCGKGVEDFQQAKALACSSVVKQMAASWSMHSIRILIFIAPSQLADSSGNTRILIWIKSLHLHPSLTTDERPGEWTLLSFVLLLKWKYLYSGGSFCYTSLQASNPQWENLGERDVIFQLTT